MTSIEELNPFGVAVDLDLAAPGSDDARDELVALYERHHLLVFRSQRLDAQRHVEVAGWFGPVLWSDGGGTGVGHVSTDTSRGTLGSGALAFHSDLACTPDPFLGLSLFALELDGATSTFFANAAAALVALPDDLRQRVERLEARHLWPQDLSRRLRQADAGPDWPGAVHPVIFRHPRTERPVLFVSAQTDCILGLAEHESEELLQQLLAPLYRPAALYEHQWAEGDFLVWDNIALQHGRREIAAGSARTLRRVALATPTTRPVRDLMPVAVLEAYGATRPT